MSQARPMNSVQQIPVQQIPVQQIPVQQVPVITHGRPVPFRAHTYTTIEGPSLVRRRGALGTIRGKVIDSLLGRRYN